MNIEKFNNECIICLELIDLEQYNHTIFNGCDHYDKYHTKCVNDWIKESITNRIIPACPICRKEIINIIEYQLVPNQIYYQEPYQVQINNNIRYTDCFNHHLHKSICIISVSISIYIIYLSFVNYNY